MDSDMGGIWDHALSRRKSVKNWPAPASLLKALQHVTDEQSISVNNIKHLTDAGSAARI